MSNKAAGRQWAGLRGTVGGLVVALAVASAATAQQDLGTATVAGGKALANQFNNPTSPMTLLQLRDVIAPAWNASEGSANLLEAEFVFPIEQGRLIHVMQLSRLTLPYEWVPDPQGGVAGFGDISYFDIGLIPTKWGRWGPGVSLVIPSGASSHRPHGGQVAARARAGGHRSPPFRTWSSGWCCRIRSPSPAPPNAPTSTR